MMRRVIERQRTGILLLVRDGLKLSRFGERDQRDGRMLLVRCFERGLCLWHYDCLIFGIRL
jgi:hypothetical protein